MTVILLHLLTLAVGISVGYVYAWATLTRTRRSAVSPIDSKAPSWLRSPVPANVALMFASLFLVLVALLAIVLQNKDKAQSGNLCRFVDDVTTTLAGRSVNYREGARAALADSRADVRWKVRVRSQLIAFGSTPKDPLIRSTDLAIARGKAAIRAEEKYLRQLRANPVPRTGPQDCS